MSDIQMASEISKSDFGLVKPDSEYRIVNNHSQLTGKDYELLIYPNGNKWYLLDYKLHRENAPAYMGVKGYQAWYIHREYHRLNGPARTYPNSGKSYWINNKRYDENEYYKELTKCRFCKYQSDSKEDLLVHYDYEEEKGNLICFQLREYLNDRK